ncbi:MAG: glycoside hydrolase family 99-like domain-containing protein [Oscillospiraceae bacterium]|nr:glycoside hydrolase family 99-like domain-containing protein [Oscillospiraceae bacterium]
MSTKNKYDVAAYVWPAYTGDEKRTRMFWAEGIGEWQSVKNAVKKFPEHSWPRKPLWGYVNEADPYVMEMQIEAATDHGVNVFIYDWYWYDRRPFLENCLNDGFLKAKNNGKMKFYLMWANHTANNTWDIRNSWEQDNIIWDGAVDRKEFEIIAKRVIEKYFKSPLYYQIDGKPVFMIYDIDNLIRGLDGIDNTVSALDWFRNECVKSGLNGLHLQLTKWGDYAHNLSDLSGFDRGRTETTQELFDKLGFDSFTNYQFVHFVNIDRDYNEIVADVLRHWEINEKTYKKPYFPHVSIGWDNNPRFYEFKPGIVKNNTPENFAKALGHAKKYADIHPVQPPLITINSWNEWTETSYLLPDDLYGYGYLEAVKKVFLT